MKNYLLPHQDNEALKEINQTYKEVMPVLHYDCGFDYSKPYRVIKHSGKFTIKSLQKDYSIESDDNVAILYKDTFFKMLKLYVYPDGENVTNYHSIEYRTNLSYIDVHDFYSKKEFEETRKAGGVFYIFVQSSNYRKESYQRKTYKCFSPADREYKGRLNFCNNKRDRSGYLIEHYRNELKARLRKYRADQDKKNLNKKELSEEVEKHTNIARKQKEVIVNLLSNVDVLDRSNFSSLLDIQYDISNYSRKIKDLSMCKAESNFRIILERCEYYRKRIVGGIDYYKQNYIKA